MNWSAEVISAGDDILVDPFQFARDLMQVHMVGTNAKHFGFFCSFLRSKPIVSPCLHLFLRYGWFSHGIVGSVAFQKLGTSEGLIVGGTSEGD